MSKNTHFFGINCHYKKVSLHHTINGEVYEKNI